MLQVSIPTVTISSGVVLSAITYIYQRRKYAKSITRELGLESFSTYLRRGLVLQPDFVIWLVRA
jgi:hypothetical protein